MCFQLWRFARRTYMTMPASTAIQSHRCTYISSVCLALMRMELHFAAVIVDVDFPPLSLKIRFARPRGLPIVLSASPLCMTALCRRCSTKQPHWNAANAPPLWHKKHFIDTLFLHSSEYNQRYLSGLGSWLIQWLYTHKYTDAHRILSSTPLKAAREKALCCIGMKVAVSCIERIHWKWVVFMSLLWNEKGCNGVFGVCLQSPHAIQSIII